MGAPRTHFSLLWALKETEERQHQKTLERLGDFSLFAMVLEAPDGPFDVTRAIQAEFERLDVGTGKRLLFISLIDEPPGWRRLLVERWGSKARELVETYCERLHLADRSKAAHAVASLLGVESRNLPAIALTTDPRANKYVLVPTDAARVGQQLLRIGGIADGIPPLRERLEGEPHAISPEAVDAATALEVQLEDSWAETLYQGLAPSLLGQYRNYAASGIREALARHWQRLALLRQEQNRDPSSAPTDLLLSELERFAVLCPTSTEPAKGGLPPLRTPCIQQPSPPGEPRTGWESESCRWFELGDNVLNYLGAAGESDYDYSPAAVCWAKAFERELALSVGHFIRWYLRLAFPRYFDRYQPGIEARLPVGKTRKIDFNLRGQSDKWQAPTLDGLRMALNAKADEVPAGALLVQALLAEWKEIQQIRNQVCHPYQVLRAKAEMMRSALVRLEQGGVLRQLGEIKASIRTHGQPWHAARHTPTEA